MDRVYELVVKVGEKISRRFYRSECRANVDLSQYQELLGDMAETSVYVHPLVDKPVPRAKKKD